MASVVVLPQNTMAAFYGHAGLHSHVSSMDTSSCGLPAEAQHKENLGPAQHAALLRGSSTSKRSQAASVQVRLRFSPARAPRLRRLCFPQHPTLSPPLAHPTTTGDAKEEPPCAERAFERGVRVVESRSPSWHAAAAPKRNLLNLTYRPSPTTHSRSRARTASLCLKTETAAGAWSTRCVLSVFCV